MPRAWAIVRRVTGGEAVPAVLAALLGASTVAWVVARHFAGPPAWWMNVDVALALAPPVVATALALFRRRRLVWSAGLVVLVLLLPNSPYVLTDVVHLRADLAYAHSLGGSGASLVAAFVAMFAIGLTGYAYVLSLLVVGLVRSGWRRLAGPAVVATHAACAIGIWLGRVARLNSWDAAHPRVVAAALQQAANPRGVALITFAFVSVGAATVVLVRMTNVAANRIGPVWRRFGGPPLRPQH